MLKSISNHSLSSMRKGRPTLLIILDGWGENPSLDGNAIAQANTPNIDKFWRYYPQILLQASGISVGLPWGEVGNSEVGHLTIGAGRVIYQSLPRISLSIQNGSFFENEALRAAVENVKKFNSTLHLMGLASSGGVHSSVEHLYALIELAKNNDIKKVCLHLFTDGRDSPTNQAQKLVEVVEERLRSVGCGRISTLCGRYFAMDRNDNWDRIKKAYNLLTSGEGKRVKNALEAIRNSYKENITDEFVEPIVVEDEKGNIDLVSENDSLIFFNFREDRARQITKAFVLPTFLKFEREKYLPNLEFVCMTEYEDSLPVKIAFPPQKMKNCLGEILSLRNLRQLRIAETEKYAHVTYFFNGGQEEPFKNEDRSLVPSQPVPTYDKAPEMSAIPITEHIRKDIATGKYDFVLINYANADMVGHTGNLQATISAIETVDSCLGKLIPDVLNIGGEIFITSDHGNAEELINQRSGQADTEHSSFPVPFWYINSKNQRQKSESEILRSKTNVTGLLSDIAPTILAAMGIPIPPEMTGQSLLDLLK